jgi:hypothetical protein
MGGSVHPKLMKTGRGARFSVLAGTSVTATRLGMPNTITAGRMTYDLRRLRLHGTIERIPKTHRYQVTPIGLREALVFPRVHARLYRPGVAEITANGPPEGSGLARQIAKLEEEIDKQIQRAKLAA